MEPDECVWVANLIALGVPATAADVEPDSPHAISESTAVVVTPSTTASLSAIVTDNCAECGLSDPPSTGRVARRIKWILCEKCQFWYHLQCTQLKALPCANAEFICSRCREH